MDNQATPIESSTRRPLEEIEVRRLKPEDLPFLFSTWLYSYRFSRFAKRIKKDIYFFWHHLLIENILKRPTVTVLVAHLKGDPDVILGYMATETVKGEPRIVHYCFVKENFRRHGIARLLFETSGTQATFYFTHWTFAIDSMVERNTSHMIYDPYRI